MKEKPLMDYTIPLKGVFSNASTKRTNVAIRLVKDFVKKHYRSTDVKIAREVNEELWTYGKHKCPRKVEVSIKKMEEYYKVYLKNGKELAEEMKQKTKVKKASEKPRDTKKVDAKEAEEQKKKLEEKKAKETADKKQAFKK